MGKGEAVIVCCLGDRPTAADGSSDASTCMRGVPDERVAAGGRYRRRMMYRARRLSGAALAITMFATLALALALSANAGAQKNQPVKVNLT